ncbi:MAG: GNAT family N-acetyltransferase [Gammaproteobacteria bacterium]|nr:GNAT family N-acetyltransferase [Gammaproteobacteria bacterium]MCP5425272.1 GNAT family N-acetyltransferase [Gammaproteobacteria bacterium]
MPDWLSDERMPGNVVTLEPLRPSHREALVEAASDGKLWELWYTVAPSPSSIDDYLAAALRDKEAGRSLPFVVVENASNTVVGSTRFLNIEASHRHVEIGHTWYSQRVQRTAVNTECKWLLLSRAFDQFAAIAVEFRTHWHNKASREAIARLGAKQDGVLRSHQLGPDGTIRDTVVFSIIQSEWPTVKRHLQFQLARRR